MSEPAGGAGAEITLPERGGTAAAQALAAAGCGLAPGARLRVNAGAVAGMSCAAAVALASVAKTAALAGGAVVVHAPSAALTDAFAELGLFECLMSMEFGD